MAGQSEFVQLPEVTGIVSSLVFLPEKFIALVNRFLKRLYIQKWVGENPDGRWQTTDLAAFVGPEYLPSDIQLAEPGTVLLTYTSDQATLAILFAYAIGHNDDVRLTERHRLKINDRARSVCSLGGGYYAALTAPALLVVDANGRKRDSVDRSKPDRGGFVRSFDGQDGIRRVAFGDYDDFVICRWDGKRVDVDVRLNSSKMRRPRSCVLDERGRLLLACDNNNIVRTPLDKIKYDVIARARSGTNFGCIASHPTRQLVVVSVWEKVEQRGLPCIYRNL